MKIKITRKTAERSIYILIVVILVAYGFKDSEAAATLIQAVKEAFSILL
jgi:hypothetical protein